jgi:ribulose-bisphosphate carboxylase small chain
MTDNVAMDIQDYRSLLKDSKSRKFETFSYLQEMDAKQIRTQIQALIDKEWDLAIEHVEPERSNKTYWYMWKLPMFGEWNIDTIMTELNACRNAYPHHHIKVIGYDGKRQTQGMAMVVYRAESRTAE